MVNMQFYLSEITKAQEEERKRIAREIHDDIIQSLAALTLEIDVLCQDKTSSRDDLMTRLQGLRSGMLEVVDKLRWFIHELHPSVIDQGLIPALEDLIQEISQGTNINAQITIYGNERRLSEEMELCLFRIAQEAMRNIVKHSAATEAAIKLRYNSNSIKLTISDNGIGFELPEVGDLASKHKLGIIGMQERSHLIEGKFSLRSRVGKGTTVMIETPIKI
jgi:two-component system sensor histidine kinase DegS